MMSVAGSGNDGIQLVNIKLDSDNIVDQRELQMEQKTSRAR